MRRNESAMPSPGDGGPIRQWPDLSCELGESLIWDERCERYWWVDVHTGTLFRARIDDEKPQRWQFGEPIGHLALGEQPHTVVLGLASGLLLFDYQQGTQRRLVDVPHEAAGMRINDGRCDRHGNLVFGTMSEGGKGPRGAFWRFSARDGLRRLDLPPPAIPNSICFSPDGTRLYFADSLLKVIDVCDYDPVSGAVSGVRAFADPGEVPWEPDGSCIDADGGLWNARWGGGCIVRYLPTGQIDRVIASPARQPTCPCLGGPKLDRLGVTSAHVGLGAELRSAADGAILTWANLGVLGLREGRVAGV